MVAIEEKSEDKRRYYEPSDRVHVNPSNHAEKYLLGFSILTLLNFDQATLHVSYFCCSPARMENKQSIL